MDGLLGWEVGESFLEEREFQSGVGGARQVGLRLDKREIGVNVCWATF